MFILGTKNTGSQTVDADGIINVGATYRRYSRKNYGINTFINNGTSITLNASGIYHITALVEGATSVDLLENGVSVLTSTNGVIDYYILVDGNFVLGVPSLNSKAITLTNSDTVEATITSVVVNIDKVV